MEAGWAVVFQKSLIDQAGKSCVSVRGKLEVCLGHIGAMLKVYWGYVLDMLVHGNNNGSSFGLLF